MRAVIRETIDLWRKHWQGVAEADANLAYGILQEDIGWTRLGQARRDIPAAAHDEMLRQAAIFYDRNPLGKWLLEMTRDLICAEGLEVQSDDDATQELLTKFWTHPINNWDLNLPKMVLELGLWGEQCYPVFTPDTGSGIAVLGLVDSADIKAVVHDPDNCAVPIGVILKDRGEREGAKLRIIYSDPDNELFAAKAIRMRAEEFTDGQCFWHKINTVRAATRGRSDLYAVGDWLDGFEQYLFNALDRTGFLNAFTWDVTLEGMDRAQIQQWLKDNPVPKPGSWFAHNERIQLQAVTPNLNASDTSDQARLFRNHVLGSLGYPEHWFAEGGDVNRACYDSQTEVLTIEGFKSYQDITKDTLIAMYDPEADCLQWTPAGPCYVYPYDGPMIHFLNQNVDMMVTPDHRMYAKRERNRKEAEAYEIIQAQDMVANRWSVLTATPFEEEPGVETFTLPSVPTGTTRAIYPEIDIDGDTWAEFLGYWLSEGHARVHKGRYVVNLAQKDPVVTEKIRACLQRLPEIRWRESMNKDGCTRWVVSDKALCIWLMEHCGILARNKHIPAMAEGFSQHQRRILFEALVDGDGSRDMRDGHTGIAYYTSSPRLADDVQRLAIQLGYRAKVTDLREQTRVLRLQLVPGRRETMIGMQALKYVPYNGKVFCYSVPSGLFVTRRNGKIAIQGNTAAEMSTPTFKRYIQRQRTVRHICETILDYQMTLGRQGGLIPADTTYTLTLPQMVTEDIPGIAAALVQLTSATQIAADNNWISPDIAARLFAKLAERTGVEIDLSEIDTPEGRADARFVTRDYRRRQPMANGAA